ESPKYYFSPRLGISHPLTEKSKIYFNYGHFVQTPPTHALYPVSLDGQNQRVQWMGNGALTFEKNIAYELGYDQNVGDVFQLHLGAFYKDYHDHASGVVYAHSNKTLILESTSQRENREIRGLEIEIRKAYGRWCTGWVNYSISRKSVSDLRIPGLSQIPIITDDPDIGIDGELRGIPRQHVPDVVPYGRGVFTLTVPEDWGPRWKGWSVLSQTALSLQFFYQGGKLVDHPSLKFRIDHPEVKFRELDYYWANIRLARRLNYHFLRIEFYLDISNVLHSKFRELPDRASREDYFMDLFYAGRLNELGTDKLSEPGILNTESDNIYRGKLKEYVLGLRFNF
ncbi:TonB-dependent receptor, partial [candidate division KSB1 bacterium]|nr:TonB-dependent receptor [candidate division KSB1 bacterium]